MYKITSKIESSSCNPVATFFYSNRNKFLVLTMNIAGNEFRLFRKASKPKICSLEKGYPHKSRKSTKKMGDKKY